MTTKKPAKAKAITRQLRLTTTVNAIEKQRAERIAKDEGFGTVGELVRSLLADRHQLRLKKAKAKKERAAKKKTSLRTPAASLSPKSRNALPLRNPSLAAKPSRTVSTRKRPGSSTASRAAKKALNSGVVPATNHTGSTTRRRAVRSSAANR